MRVFKHIKVSCVISAIANSPKFVRIYLERTAEAKIPRLGPWLKDCILLLNSSVESTGGQSMVDRRFWVVCAFNSGSGKYHTYLTNIPVETQVTTAWIRYRVQTQRP